MDIINPGPTATALIPYLISSWKANNSRHVFLDPKVLNKVIVGKKYKVPIVKEVTNGLRGFKV